jgi:hypothetical protein
MTDKHAGAIVNEHYLNKVLDLSDEMGVAATEDIVDANGIKLLAKGAPVSRRLQEKLIVHRLSKPIESCLAVESGVDGKRLAACALDAVRDTPALAAILAAAGLAPSDAAGELASLRFGAAMTMMLTMTERASPTALRHVVEVALLALAFARHAGLSVADQRAACMAGVLHDIGELYIDPALVNADWTLSPEEWAHVIVHPHIGRLLIDDLETCPPAVAVAVGEHHERLNGTGYPRALAGAQISMPGQMVASAERIAVLLHGPRALQRAVLALKIVSGEHARSVAALVSQASRACGAQQFGTDADGVAAVDDADIARLADRMDAAAAQADKLTAGTALSPKHRDMMARTRLRIAGVQRAFLATGLGMHIAALPAVPQPQDDLELFETGVALHEIGWRLRDIGRDLALQLGSAREAVQAARLVALLCEDGDIDDAAATALTMRRAPPAGAAQGGSMLQ